MQGDKYFGNSLSSSNSQQRNQCKFPSGCHEVVLSYSSQRLGGKKAEAHFLTSLLLFLLFAQHIAVTPSSFLHPLLLLHCFAMFGHRCLAFLGISATHTRPPPLFRDVLGACPTARPHVFFPSVCGANSVACSGKGPEQVQLSAQASPTRPQTSIKR